MKKILLLVLSLMLVFSFVACDFSDTPETGSGNPNTNQSTPDTSTDESDKDDVSPTKYAEINNFDNKMSAHFGSKKPTITQGRGSNVWHYDFGDFEVEVWVNSYESSPRKLSLELTETAINNSKFLSKSKEILEVLLGNISDSEFQTIMDYADSTYVMSDPEFTGKLSAIKGIMYLEQKMNATETTFTIKCDIKGV